jgi:phytoene dehydrogenase-like protein
MYQVIIVGGGMAGLHTGIEVAKKGFRCCIIDEYKCGGRIQTYHNEKEGVQWENGAGRISNKHKYTLAYLKQYGLTTIPLSSEIDYINRNGIQSNPFFDLQHMILEPLRSLPADVLATHTMKQIMDKVMPHSKDMYKGFPYYAETHVLRADIALQSFAGEIGSHDGFSVCKEGLSALVDGMVNEFIELGGQLIENTHVQTIESVNDLTFVHLFSKLAKQKYTLRTPICVLAVPRDALAKLIRIPAVTSVLSKLRSVPLLRIYAVFDKHWFAGMKSTVVDSYIRYIIPINQRVIMISYTEGPFAKHWMNIDPKEAERLVMKEIRALFPEKDIPDPVFFKMHPWRDGCTYWLPGRYSVEDESRAILNPKKGIFVCGESYAVHQCWIESAVEHAELLWSHPEFLGALKHAMKNALKASPFYG